MILTEDLNMGCIAARCVPSCFEWGAKADLKQQLSGMDQTVRSWQGLSSQRRNPGSPQPKEAQVRFSVKSVITLLFSVEWIVYKELMRQGWTVNETYCQCVFKTITKGHAKKKTVELKQQNVFFATTLCSHTALSMHTYLGITQMTMLTHHAYSPSLAPSDFYFKT
jgi:hypothetical protein